MKRFWKTVTTAPDTGGLAIHLDGRPLRTPAKAPLVVPSAALADMIADEWRAQGETVDPVTMPATRMANAAIDKVTPQFAEVADMLAGYGDSDLLCYRADAPEALVARQSAAWDPLLEWAAETLGARLQPVTGIMPRPQDPAALARLAAPMRAFTPFQLAAFHDLVTIPGSMVIALAAIHGARSLDELWSAATLDETWQEEKWGTDPESRALSERKRQDFFHAAQFFRHS